MLEKDPGGWKLVWVGEGTGSSVWIIPKILWATVRNCLVWRRGGQGGPEETPRGHISSMLEKDPGGWRKVRAGEGTWSGVWIVPLFFLVTRANCLV
jgi:hypothetical protein